MKYKRIINRILQENRQYDPFYPEHKPIREKLSEMKENADEYLLNCIKLNLKNIKSKGEQFKGKIKCKNIFDFIYEVLLWNLEFDITEDYIWHKVISAPSIDFLGLEKLAREFS